MWPNPSFLPKRLSAFHVNQPINLAAFASLSGVGESSHSASLLCPVRALRDSTFRFLQSFVKLMHYLFCHSGSRKEQALSKQRLYNWIVDTISMAYSLVGLQVPSVKCHSTRSVSTSWAALRGVPLNDICAAAALASSCTFARFYRVNVAAPHPVATAVLSASSAHC